jgi:hypothetical protein
MAAGLFSTSGNGGSIVGDRNDATQKARAVSSVSPKTIALDEDSDTIYQPPAKDAVEPKSDAVLEQPGQRNRRSGRFAAIVQLIVRRRRRAD